MTERLFFALWPGEGQRKALNGVQGLLPAGPGRLTHPEDLHINLVFLGDLDAEGRACAEGVADLARATPFALSLDRLGCFPRVRVLWCGVSESPQPLQDLLYALESGLRRCGLRPAPRSFKPHVTLARKAQPLPARGLDQSILWPVSDFALVVGRPGERPRYRVERRWPLIP